MKGVDQAEAQSYLGVDMDSRGDKRGRKENGLVELTKKFIDLLKEAH